MPPTDTFSKTWRKLLPDMSEFSFLLLNRTYERGRMEMIESEEQSKGSTALAWGCSLEWQPPDLI